MERFPAAESSLEHTLALRVLGSCVVHDCKSVSLFN